MVCEISDSFKLPLKIQFAFTKVENIYLFIFYGFRMRKSMKKKKMIKLSFSNY